MSGHNKLEDKTGAQIDERRESLDDVQDSPKSKSAEGQALAVRDSMRVHIYHDVI